MKKKGIIIVAVALVVLIAIFAVAYFTNKRATTVESKNIVIEVKNSSGDISNYDIATNAEYLRGAMDELMAKGTGFSYTGTDGDYGIMIESVNGEKADYAADKSYWAIYVNGEYGQYGADSVPVADGDTYALVHEVEK